MKYCKSCKKEKEEEEFAGRRGRIFKRCQSCRNKVQVYWDKNKEVLSAQKKAYYEMNKEHISARKKAHRRKHIEEYRRRDTEYWEKNKEARGAAAKVYRERNKEFIKKQKKEYNERNKGVISVKRRRYYERNKDAFCAQKKIYHERNKERISRYYKQEAAYETYKDKLSEVEDPQLGINGKLLVRCRVCKKRFAPNNVAVSVRVQVLKGKLAGNCFIYCSEECKQNCPDFRDGQNLPPHAGVRTNKWSRKVKERDKYRCQMCGHKEKVVAHHVAPVARNPELAGVINNGVTLCYECHKYVHSQEGMTFSELKKLGHKRRKQAQIIRSVVAR